MISFFDEPWFVLFEVRLVQGGLAPDATEHAVVLAAVKDAARR